MKQFCITITIEGGETLNLFADNEAAARIAMKLLATCDVEAVQLNDPKGSVLHIARPVHGQD